MKSHKAASALEISVAKFQFRNFGAADRQSLWVKLGKMTSNGMSLLNAINEIRDRKIKAGQSGHPVTLALMEWSRQLRNGQRLSGAIADWATDEEVMLIKAGEQSGKLETALNSTIEVMNAKKEIRSAVLGGILYPIFLFAIAFAVLYLFGFKIVPAFTNVVHGAEWKGLAHVMVKISEFTRSWLWLVIVAIVGLVVAFFVSLPRFDGPLRIRLDRYAPYSIYRVMQGSSWLIATSALINAGLRNEAVLEQLMETASPWLKRRLHACLQGMRSGHNMGEALERSGYEFPDREIIADLGVYASLSGFDEALSNAGRQCLTESVVDIKLKMKVIFGVSILVVGAVIGIMVSGMMAMQLQLGQILQQSMH